MGMNNISISLFYLENLNCFVSSEYFKIHPGHSQSTECVCVCVFVVIVILKVWKKLQITA